MSNVYQIVNGKKIKLTDVELSERVFEYNSNLDKEIMENWSVQIEATDAVLPRWAEDIIDVIGTENLAIQTVDKYLLKKEIRSKKP